MVNKILDAISTQLGKTFGTNYKYYVEDVNQGLTRPCFTIDAITPLQRSKSKVLYDRTIPIVIHYFSNNDVNKKEGYSIAEQVVECLEYLPFGDTFLLGRDIYWQFVDDVPQIFITYKFTTKKDEVPVDNMEDLSEVVSHG